MSKKIAEAEKLVKDGKKNTKKTWFKKNPDYELASSNFRRASKVYKGLNEWNLAIDTLLLSSQANKDANIPFSVGHDLEEAAMIYEKKLGNNGQASKLLEEAGGHFLEDAKYVRAAQAYTKAAKLLEKIDKKKSLELYKKGLKLYLEDEQEYYGIDDFRRALNQAVDMQEFETALQIIDLKKQVFVNLKQLNSLYKTCLEEIIILIHMGDYERLNKAMEECGQIEGFFQSDEGKGALRLMDAIDEYNEEEFEKAKQSTDLNYIERHVLRLARNLKIIFPDKEQDIAEKNIEGDREEDATREALFGGIDRKKEEPAKEVDMSKFEAESSSSESEDVEDLL